MTATTVTYLAAQGHINHLRREAERHRRGSSQARPCDRWAPVRAPQRAGRDGLTAA